MLNELVSEFKSVRDQIVGDTTSKLSPHAMPQHDANTSSIRKMVAQLKAVGISTPYIERFAWGLYWSSEEPGKPSTFRQGHVDVTEVQHAPEKPPKLTIHEWLFDPDRRMTREIAVLA
jgi:hypothetical protein